MGPAWPVWTGVGNLATTGIRSPDRPARSESLYRLSYRRPFQMYIACININVSSAQRLNIVTRLVGQHMWCKLDRPGEECCEFSVSNFEQNCRESEFEQVNVVPVLKLLAPDLFFFNF